MALRELKIRLRFEGNAASELKKTNVEVDLLRAKFESLFNKITPKISTTATAMNELAMASSHSEIAFKKKGFMMENLNSQMKRSLVLQEIYKNSTNETGQSLGAYSSRIERLQRQVIKADSTIPKILQGTGSFIKSVLAPVMEITSPFLKFFPNSERGLYTTKLPRTLLTTIIGKELVSATGSTRNTVSGNISTMRETYFGNMLKCSGNTRSGLWELSSGFKQFKFAIVDAWKNPRGWMPDFLIKTSSLVANIKLTPFLSTTSLSPFQNKIASAFHNLIPTDSIKTAIGSISSMVEKLNSFQLNSVSKVFGIEPLSLQMLASIQANIPYTTKEKGFEPRTYNKPINFAPITGRTEYRPSANSGGPINISVNAVIHSGGNARSIATNLYSEILKVMKENENDIRVRFGLTPRYA